MSPRIVARTAVGQLPDHATIGRDHAAESRAPIFTDYATRRRSPFTWDAVITLAIAVAAGAFGLSAPLWSGSQWIAPPHPADRSDGGMVVRTELAHVWLPKMLIEWTRCPSSTPALVSHADLMRYLERHGGQEVWYGITLVCHRASGRSNEMTLIRRPYDEPLYFAELLEIRAVATGTPARGALAPLANTAVHQIAGDLLRRDPREAVAEMLEQVAWSSARLPAR